MKQWTPKSIIVCVCFISAGAVAMSGHDGWGWLIAAGAALWFL